MPRQPAKQEDADRPLSRRVLVNIHRDKDMQVVPRIVWAHEVPILEAIHQTVREVDPSSLDEGYTDKPKREMFPWNSNAEVPPRPSAALRLGWVFVGDPEAEYDRLAQCYGMHPEVKQPWVENVYGRFSGGAFRSLLGRPRLDDLPEDQLRSMILDGTFYSLPTITYDAPDDERRAAEQRIKAFRALKREDLLKLAEEAGVVIGA